MDKNLLRVISNFTFISGCILFLATLVLGVISINELKYRPFALALGLSTLADLMVGYITLLLLQKEISKNN